MNARVDVVLVLSPDRDLHLVARRRQVERAAEGDERPGRGERDAALEALRLDLGLLAQPLGVEQRGEAEREEEEEDAACSGGGGIRIRTGSR